MVTQSQRQEEAVWSPDLPAPHPHRALALGRDSLQGHLTRVDTAWPPGSGCWVRSMGTRSSGPRRPHARPLASFRTCF